MGEPNDIERVMRVDGGTSGRMLTIGSIVAGRFVLLSHLGSGRLGPIYEAVDRVLSGADPHRERRVALHAIAESRAAGDLYRELEQWRAAPQVWLHPNIVKVLDFGRDGTNVFVLTELLEGLTLRAVLDDIAPELLSTEESLAIVGKVGAALNYAHAKGAVHGDLRPETVFVTTSFAVKVLDLWPTRATSQTPFFGEDDHAGARARPCDDVYALACLAYELLTGRHPYNANAPREARRAGLTAAPIVGLPQGHWQAIARGLELRSAARTQTVAELLAELGVTGREPLRLSGRSAASDEPPRLDDVVAPPSLPSPPAPAGQAMPRARLAPPSLPRERAPPQVGRPPPAAAVHAPRRSRRARAAGRRRFGAWFGLVPLALIGALTFAVWRDYEAVSGTVAALVASGVTGVADVDDAPTNPAAAADAETRAAPASATDVEAQVAADADGSPADAPAADRDARTNATAGPQAPADPLTAGADGQPQQPPPPPQPQRTETFAEESAPRPAVRGAPLETTAAAAVPRSGSRAPRGSDTAARDPTVDVAGAGAGAGGNAVPTELEFAFVAPAVTVAEGDAMARIRIRRVGGTSAAARVFWWTGGHTAKADDDYADLDGTETLAAGETRDVLVPLVDDVWPEGAESFFVYLGTAPERGRMQTPLTQAEVFVIDDDR